MNFLDSGLTFICDTPDGRKFRASVARKILDNDAANHQKIYFLVEMSNGELNEIIAYNELSNIIEDRHNQELNEPKLATWSFKGINDHQGPLQQSDK
jgi:heat shock protein HspQ